MNTDYIKTKAYGIEAAYQVDSSRKHAKQLIKGLSQKQRKLLIHILQNPEARVDEAVLKQLNRALTTPKSRNKGLSVKISRAWKNRFNDRVKSSSVFAALSSNKSKSSKAKLPTLPPLSLKASPPRNRPLDLKWQLGVLKSASWQLDELTDFLAINAKELAAFAFQKPTQWKAFSKKMQKKISCEKTNRLFINLNRCINLACVKSQKPGFNPCFPREIVDLIALKFPAESCVEKSLFAMQMLYRANVNVQSRKCALGSIPLKNLANWTKAHQMTWSFLDLPIEDLRKLSQFVDKSDLLPAEALKFEHDSGDPPLSFAESERVTIKKEALKENLKYLALFKNLQSVAFDAFQDGWETIFKDLNLTRITFMHSSISDNVFKSCSFLRELAMLNCTGYSQAGIKCLTRLSNLAISPNHPPEQVWKAIVELPNLTTLSVPNPPLKDLMALKELPNLIEFGITIEDDTEIPCEPLMHIQSLTVSKKKLSAIDMQNIGKMPHLHTLYIIADSLPAVELNMNLQKIVFVVPAVENLALIQKLPNLKQLWATISIPDEDLKSLQAMTNLSYILWAGGEWKKPKAINDEKR